MHTRARDPSGGGGGGGHRCIAARNGSHNTSVRTIVARSSRWTSRAVPALDWPSEPGAPRSAARSRPQDRFTRPRPDRSRARATTRAEPPSIASPAARHAVELAPTRPRPRTVPARTELVRRVSSLSPSAPVTKRTPASSIETSRDVLDASRGGGPRDMTDPGWRSERPAAPSALLERNLPPYDAIPYDCSRSTRASALGALRHRSHDVVGHFERGRLLPPPQPSPLRHRASRQGRSGARATCAARPATPAAGPSTPTAAPSTGIDAQLLRDLSQASATASSASDLVQSVSL